MWIIQDAAVQTEWSHRKPAGEVEATHMSITSDLCVKQFAAEGSS